MDHPNTAADALSLTHVSKRLGGALRIDDMSLRCTYGRVYGLIGPNGSGKTTLLKLITGLYRADEGLVRVGGLDPVADYKEVRRRFGLLPQDTALYPELSARQNLAFHGALYSRDTRRMAARIDEILSLIGLEDRQRERVKGFSGGMKRRLGIGLALLNDPQLIFLDEPTLGVDVQNAHRIWAYVRALKQQGKTVLVTTNVMSEAEQLCDEIFLIAKGRKLCEGTPDALKRSIGGSYIALRLADPPGPDVLTEVLGPHERIDAQQAVVQAPEGETDLLRLLDRARGRLTIEGVALKRPTLDDVFVHYTETARREEV